MQKSFIVLMLSVMTTLNFSSCTKKEEVNPVKQAPVVSDSSVSDGKPAPKPSDKPVQQPAVVAYTIKASESTVDGSKLNLPPGSVVAIEAGSRGPLYLKNFTGTASQPITFINAAGGQAILKGSGPWALKVGACKNIRITGSGGGGEYGLVVDGGNNGFVLPELSTDFEIDHVEVRNTGFAGIMAKTDPNCDSKTWRDNFVMRNVSFHHNYIHDVGGEGFYIGNSFYNGKQESCGTVYPHTIEGIRVYENTVKNSGCEGIQVGCATKDCEIYNNHIENYGKTPFANYQNNGLQIGAGTSGKCYNNVILNGPGNGLIMNGTGGNIVYNNIIVNAGALGIFCDERTTPVGGYSFINNTIVNSGSDGIKLYSEQVDMNNVINNIIINPGTGKYINTSSGVRLNEKNNYYSKDLASVKFANPGSGNYSLLNGSPAVNKGQDVSSFGIREDLKGSLRPIGGAFDIGAYEFTGSSAL